MNRVNKLKNFYKYVNESNKESLDEIFDKKIVQEGKNSKVYVDKNTGVIIKESIVNETNLPFFDKISDIPKISINKETELYIEPIVCTLINQLLLQEICPFYNMNYYWTSTKNSIILFNEQVKNDTGAITLLNWLKFNGDLGIGHYQEHYEELYNLFTQILIGLIVMQKKYSLIHGDLHCENILIQKIQKGGYLVFKINGKMFKIKNIGYIVIFNDFGYSSIYNKFGSEWYKRVSLDNLSPNVHKFYDLFYLLDTLEPDIGFFKYLYGESFQGPMYHIMQNFSGIFDALQIKQQYNDTRYNKKTREMDYKKITYSGSYGLYNILEMFISHMPNDTLKVPNETIETFYDTDKQLDINGYPENLKEFVL